MGAAEDLENESAVAQMKQKRIMQIKQRKLVENLGVSEQTVATLLSLVDWEGHVTKVSNQLRGVLRKKNSKEAALLAKEAQGRRSFY